MNTRSRYSWPFVLALALHLAILALFALSALWTHSSKDGQPVPEIIHARIVEKAPEQPEPIAESTP
ncbi:MAG: cell envelope integrity protein TolA, partial [Methylosarcina sp.]